MPLFRTIRRNRITRFDAYSGLLATVLAGLLASLVAASQLGAAGGPDKSAPSAPTNIHLVDAHETDVTVGWNASTDNVRVEGYRVTFANGRAARTQDTTYHALGLTCGLSWPVEVRAYDHVRNLSPPARSVVATASCLDVQPPTAPTGLQQIARGPTTVSLAWQPSSDNVAVAGYALSRDGVEIDVTTETAYVFTGLSCGRTYSVAVRAYDVALNDSGWASYYLSTSACGDVSAPSAPSGLVQLDGSQTSMSVAWRASTDDIGVAKYVVYRGSTPVAETTALTFALTGLACATAYTVGVEAVDAAGNRSARTTATMSTASCGQPPPPPGGDTQPPSVPGSLSVGSATASSIALNWAASTDNVGVGGYDVFRDGVRVSVVTAPSFTHTGLSCGTSYVLGVESYDAAGNRSARASVTASTSPCADSSPPTQPGNLALLSRTGTSVTVSWAASTDNVGVAGYGAYRDGTLVGSTTETTYTFTGLACGTSRTFGIDAYDTAGNRSSRASVVLQTAACGDTQAPSTPTQLAVLNKTQTGATLSWAASSDNVAVAGYDVYVNGSKVATVTGASSAVANLTCNTAYTLGVEAFDAAGNRSSRASVSMTTSACSAPPPPLPPSGGSTKYVSPSGSDSAACTQLAPCASFNRAYTVAKPGETVQVAAGSYPTQTMKFDATKESASIRVVFNLDPQAQVAGDSTLWGVQHVEFRGGAWTKVTLRPSDSRGLVPGSKLAADVVISGAKLKSFLIRNGQQVTVRDSDVGGFNVASGYGVPKVGSFPPEDGAVEQPSRDILIERVFFHDVVRTDQASSHAECLFIENGHRVTVRLSRFTNCAVFDIFVEPRGVLVKDLVIEGNMLDVPRGTVGEPGGFPISLKGGPFLNVAIRWNSILGDVRTDSGSPDWGSSGTLTFVGNAWRNSGCSIWPAQAFVANVGSAACGSSDVKGDPGFVSARTDPCNLDSCYRNDLHLVSGALAVGRGPSGSPSVDIDGQGRPQGAPDAGADERS